MFIIVIAPFLLYGLLLIVVLLLGEKKEYHSIATSTQLFFTIVIPFRNEEENLSSLIYSIKQLEYDRSRFEVIFIDDHSEDDGLVRIEKELKGSEINWKLILHTDRQGKKNAIKLGVKKARYDIIAMTDADCILPKNWLNSLSFGFLSKKLDLVLGPIKYKQRGFFTYLQKVELAALMSLTSLSCKIGRAILGNAANMAFRKEIFKENYLLDNKSESGDDIFLLYALKKLEGIKIGFIANAPISTRASTTLKGFIAQRLRWASKSKYIKDRDAIIYGIFTLILNVVYIALFIVVLIYPSYFFYLIFTFLIKLFCDTTLVVLNQNISRIQYPFIGAVLLSIIYPFYSILIASFSLFLKPQWKGRRI